MRIIQITTTLSYGDAVGNDILALDKVLKKEGYTTGIYAENIGKRIPSGIANYISKLPKLKKEDIILYHLSIATPFNYQLPQYPAKKVVVYHNVTPYKFFSGYSHLLWKACRQGINEVEYLSDKVDYCIADSAFNKQDLQNLGYNCPIDVIPVLIPFEDYTKTPSKKILEKYYDDEYKNILFTGRVVPNKCQEDVIAAFYQYHTYYNKKSRLILAGNYEGMETYYYRLKEYVKRLNIDDAVIFTGHIKFNEILAYYHIADLFLCMSEHEGFCVPLVEAMFFDIPIVAYDCAAVPFTLDGSGFLLKEKNPLETAGVINYVLEKDEIREAILYKQRKRLETFSNKLTEKEFLSCLNTIIEGGK